MKALRTARLIIAAISLAAAVGFLLLLPSSPGWLRPVYQLQIVPSMWISAAAAAIATGLFWLVTTLFIGRIYCSTLCPVGTIIAIFGRIRYARGKTYRYRQKGNSRYWILGLYLISLLTGEVVVAFLVEPWNMMRNITSMVNPEAEALSWGSLGLPAAVGAVAGAVTLVAFMVWGLLRGREFCSDYCPIGTAMGLLHNQTMLHIEIDPDLCDGCLECEDVCQASCINVAGRYVDDSRCLRCFECGAKCPRNAIRLQRDRNRRMTPLLKKVKQT